MCFLLEFYESFITLLVPNVRKEEERDAMKRFFLLKMWNKDFF